MRSFRLLSAFSALFLFSISLFAQKIGDPLPDGAASITEGIVKYNNGNYKGAIDDFLKVSESDSLYSSALFELALAYQADSAYDKALDNIEKFTSLRTSDRLNAICMKGTILDKMGKRQEALAVYTQAEKMYGHSYRPYYERAVTEIANKDFKAALKDLEQSLIRNPLHLNTHLQIAILASDAEEYALCEMAAFFASMLTNTDKQDLILFSISLIENTAGGKTEKIQPEITSELFDFTADLQVIDEVLYSGTALNDRYKSKLKDAFSYSKQMQVMCEQLSSVGRSDNHILNFYTNFYKEVWAKNLFTGMMASSFGTVDNQRAQAISNKYKSDATKFNQQVFSLFESSMISFEYTNLWGSGKGFPIFNQGEVAGVLEKDAKGEKNGQASFFYDSGELSSKGHYQAGLASGKWISYYNNGMIKSEYEYDKGMKQGVQIEYYSNGMMSKRYTADKDNSVGPVEEFSTNGYPDRTYELNLKGQAVNDYFVFDGHDFPSLKINFSVPDKIGKATFYKDNGEVDFSLNAVNNELNGLAESRTETGVLLSKGEMLKGERNGYWLINDEFGAISEEGSYDNGLKIGEWKEYYDNGQLSYSYSYKNGKLNGLSVHYDRTGLKLNEFVYRNGRITELKYFMPDGTVFHESKTINGVHNVVTYSDLRYKRSEGVLKNEKKEGEWKYYDVNGVLETVMTYKNDEVHGMEINYYSDGSVMSEFNYVDGLRQGYYREYFYNKTLSEEGYYLDGYYNGTIKSYSIDGLLSSETGYWKGSANGPQHEYKNGKLLRTTINEFGMVSKVISYDPKGEVAYVSELPLFSGKLKHYVDKDFKIMEATVERDRYVGTTERYNADGTLVNQITWKEGRRNGPYKDFFRNQLEEEGNYLNGKVHGITKSYVDGKLEREVEYKNGQREGRMAVYFESGQLRQERFYHEDKRDSVMTYFNEDGTIKVKLTYYDGVLINYTYPDASGKLKTPIEVKNDSGEIVAYFPNGKKSIAFTIVNGNFNGKFIEYYSDGKVFYEGTYINGYEDGLSKFYYANGKVKKEEQNKGGRAHGSTKRYYDNGKLQSEVVFVSDMLHGPAKFYTKDGKVESQGEFYEGCYRAN